MSNNTYAQKLALHASGIEDAVSATRRFELKKSVPALRYRVGNNTCDCHPETCACNDYAIYSVDTGKKHSTHFHKRVAEQFCVLLNQESPKGLKDHQIAILVGAIDAELRASLDRLPAHRELPQCTRGIISRAVVKSLTEQGLRVDEHSR